MPRAYADKQGSRVNIYVETPKGSWVRLADYFDDARNADVWIEYHGYQLITKAQSYKRVPA